MPDSTSAESMSQSDGAICRTEANSQVVSRDSANGPYEHGEKKSAPEANFVPAGVLDRPEVLVEEFDSPQRGVKVVFTACGLAADNTELDVGSQAVRLASIAGAWPSVEVPLPFACEPAPS